jgi:hypothetical protein
MPDYTYDYCKDDFPDVNYWGQNASVAQDNGEWSLSDGEVVDPLPKSYSDAEYMINIPVLKKHHRAGISIAAKNHFGSVAPFTSGAWHLHYSLPCPEATGVAVNGEYGEYRCFVDIMGHEDLGGKTILYLVDGLWSSTNWGHPPIKWEMEPFNNDWPSSLFLSQDPVAIESVCMDFLYEEFDEDHPTEGGTATDDKGPFPHFKGTDDYLRQAADPELRPFPYDPENDGSVLGSLGAHEHWNNATEKRYSRNMNKDEGIELVSPYVSNAIQKYTYSQQELTNYPNPFSEQTTVKYTLEGAGNVLTDIYTIAGQQVYSRNEYRPAAGTFEFTWNGRDYNGNRLPVGQYVLQLKTDVNGRKESHSIRMMLSR